MTGGSKPNQAIGGRPGAVAGHGEVALMQAAAAPAGLHALATLSAGLSALGSRLAKAAALFASAVELSRALEAVPPRRQRELLESWPDRAVMPSAGFPPRRP